MDWRAGDSFVSVGEAVSVSHKVIIGEIGEIGDGSMDRIRQAS